MALSLSFLPAFFDTRAGTAAAIIDHIIEGPTGMAFAAGTASVSFYLGRYSDFFLSSKKENGQREMQKYVRKTYVLVRRGDDPSERWTANGDFVVRDSCSHSVV